MVDRGWRSGPRIQTRRPYDGFKRLIDVTAATVFLLTMWPFLAAVAAVIAIDSRGPVFHRGVRVGRHGRAFRIWKFRTMKSGGTSPGPTSTAVDDCRITAVGKVLRRYKVDELPQFFNVLFGEMSMVGPRPQVPWAVERYTDVERRLLDVRPGLTDWASIEFRNEGEILKGQADPDEAYMRLIHPEKTRLALKYVEQRSLRVDLWIILRTIGAAVKP